MAIGTSTRVTTWHALVLGRQTLTPVEVPC